MRMLRIVLICVPFLFACDKQDGSGKQPTYERGADGVLYRIEKTCENGKCTYKRIPVPEDTKK